MPFSRRQVLVGAAALGGLASLPERKEAMITLRKAEDRFHTNWGWLDSWHTFSFGDHWDPRFEGFRALRVINDDRVAPEGGFPMHPHQDMEIVSYVLEGALEHKDSMGNGSIIRPGEVQRMSAGTGVRHSEFNPDPAQPVHFLQIWLRPTRSKLAPGYEQKRLPAGTDGAFHLVASPDGRDGSVTIHSDASLHVATLGPGQTAERTLDQGRAGWVHVARGAVEVNGQRLGAGDGASVEREGLLRFKGLESAEVLFFDLG